MNNFTRLKGNGLDCLVYKDRSEMGIKQTPRTPFVWFLETGELNIAGRLIPEHSDMFIYIIEEWLEETGAWNQQLLRINIALEYTTAIASKILLRMLKQMADHCQELEVSWHYHADQPYMLELGQFMAKIMDKDFEFVSIDNKTDTLNRAYKNCLVQVRELSALIISRIEHFNQISQKSYVTEEFKESILQEIQEESYKYLAQEIITLKSKYYKLYHQLDQYRLSIMTRDQREGKELNQDIRKWWANRY